MPSAVAERVTLRYAPLGASREAFTRRDSELVLSGPAGTGKTRGALEKLHLCASKYAGMRGVCIRKTLVDLVGSAIVTYKKRVLHPLDGVTFFGGSMQDPPAFRYPNGSEILLGGMDNPMKVMSKEFDIAYVNEGTELAEDDWESITSRLRNGVMPYQQLLGDCNPGPPSHWLKKRADSGRTAMLESRHEDNPTLWDPVQGAWTEAGAAYIAKLDALTGVRLLRLRKGVWAAAEGMVYADVWDAQRLLVDATYLQQRGIFTAAGTLDRSRVRRVLVGVDWGFTNPGVFEVCALDGDDRLYRFLEVYQTHRTIDWWITKAKALQSAYGIEAFICDPSEPAYIEQFRQAGLTAIPGVNRVGPGIQAVQQRLRGNGDSLPRLVFLRGALQERDSARDEAKQPASLEEEIENYVWDTSSNQKRGEVVKEEPVKKDDHALDALRYLVMYLDGAGELAPLDDDVTDLLLGTPYGSRGY